MITEPGSPADTTQSATSARYRHQAAAGRARGKRRRATS